jgi:hypothetical protein
MLTPIVCPADTDADLVCGTYKNDSILASWMPWGSGFTDTSCAFQILYYTIMDIVKKAVKLVQVETEPGLTTAEMMLTNDDLQPGVLPFLHSPFSLSFIHWDNWLVSGDANPNLHLFLNSILPPRPVSTERIYTDTKDSRAGASTMEMAELCCFLDCRLPECGMFPCSRWEFNLFG